MGHKTQVAENLYRIACWYDIYPVSHSVWLVLKKNASWYRQSTYEYSLYGTVHITNQGQGTRNIQHY